jgi:outer membrane receptor for ferrienterochelin and colicin
MTASASVHRTEPRNPPRFNAQYETYRAAPRMLARTTGNKKLKPETTTETEIGTDFTCSTASASS